ncbi:hypothetical protein PR048_015425 [Dryococelus australis]|uniref:Reverse transcriptase domain-containing protein n=1 Tax=Dryococelus australis TaxID=614101 RepID=A0ABQ9HHH0_9NEOP|nr:hypothetical protein PR048_015425 [Dryococelus australis]
MQGKISLHADNHGRGLSAILQEEKVLEDFEITGLVHSGAPVSEITKHNKETASILAHLINEDITTGIFPHTMTPTKVITLLKKYEKAKPENFRPISLLPVFSKVLERIICNRLINFFHQNHILCNEQYGFQKNQSTTLAAFNIVNYILENFVIVQYCIS